MKTGTANLPLHYGSAPRWLFTRMVHLAREITLLMVDEYGRQGLLRRLADPFWFQAFGSVLGFDWHSSGLTTTTCGALKEALNDVGDEVGSLCRRRQGQHVAPHPARDRGPRRCSERSPPPRWSMPARWRPRSIIRPSRMAISSITTSWCSNREGHWAVVQQGMNEHNHYARRYHWLGESVADFTCEPHAAIVGETQGTTLNMVAQESGPARVASAEIVQLNPDRLVGELVRLKTLDLPRRHLVMLNDIAPQRLQSTFTKAHEAAPRDFERLLGVSGVGPSTIRALSLLSELMYGAEPSFRDPARYSFAHGGKDGTPFPVNRADYDRSIQALRGVVEKIKVGERDRVDALKRLAAFEQQTDNDDMATAEIEVL